MDVVDANSDNKSYETVLPFYCCHRCYYVYKTKEEFRSSHSYCCTNNLIDTKPSIAKTFQSRYFDTPNLIHLHHRFICAYCLEQFKNFQRINFHLKKCKGPPFPCSFCTKIFRLKKELICHKEKMHSDEKPFMCLYCNDSTKASFKRNSSLQKHLITKHETDQNESFRCDKCPKRFIKKVYLTNHKTRFHNITKPFLCHNCGESFMGTSSLKVHMKTYCPILTQTPSYSPSNKEKNTYSCQHCPKMFNRKDKLDFHTAIHTGNRPFVCNLCPR